MAKRSYVTSILRRDGPCLTSELSKKLVLEANITPENARQRISRAISKSNSEVNSLAFLTFARNVRFVYLVKEFGSPRYWDHLIKILIESGSIYGLTLAALRARGGVVPLSRFPSISGAPNKLKKHLSPETILNRLIEAKLLSIINLAGIGECVSITQSDSSYYNQHIDRLKATEITESVFLLTFKNWITKMGLVSFHSSRLRGDNTVPEVASFEWDYTAPSYVGALKQTLRTATETEDKDKSGFVVCDVTLDSTIDEAAMRAFLSKCNTIRNLRNVGKCLEIFIAKKFTKEAFSLAKHNGVLAVQPDTLFGKEVSDALKRLYQTLEGSAHLIFDAEILTQVYEKLSVFEGSVSLIRGAYFEIFVAEIMRLVGFTDVRMNQIIKQQGQPNAEIDVIAIKRNHEVYFIECKGYSPHGLLPDDEFDKWLHQRSSLAYKYAKQHNDWEQADIVMQLWSTARLSEASKEKLSKMQNTTKKYRIEFVGLDEIVKKVRSTREQSLLQSFETVFLKEPLMKARTVIKAPKFRTETSFHSGDIKGDN